jgi:general secretion pathway protein J
MSPMSASSSLIARRMISRLKPRRSEAPVALRGFTLLEVLVALAVVGLFLLGLVQGSRFVLFGWDRQVRVVARIEELDAVDRTLRRLVALARPGSEWERLVFVGGLHSVAFTSVLPLPAVGSPTQRVDVELLVDADHRLLLKWTPHLHVIRTGPAPSVVSTEILQAVERLELSYWPAAHHGGWTSNWHDPVPPRLVRIRIVFPEASNLWWPDIVVAPMLEPP